MRIFQFVGVALLLLGLNTGGATAATAGRVEGQLVNGTAGGSGVDDQEIILQVYDAQQQVGEQTTQTDAAGEFSFDGLSTGAGFYYRAVVTYQDVSYQSQVGQIPEPGQSLALELTVYDTTEDDDAISVTQSHTWTSFSPGAAIIYEMLMFENRSDRSYVGSGPVVGSMGGKATLHFPLPAGARELKPQEGLMECCMVDTETDFTYTMPILPGRYPVVFSYRVPYQGASFEWRRSLAYPTAELNVLLPESDIVISSDQLEDAGLTTSDDNGTSYRRLTGSDLPAGTEISVKFEEIPVPQPQAVAAPPAALSSSPLAGFGLLAGGAVLVLAAAYLLWQRRTLPVQIDELGPETQLDDEPLQVE